MELSREFDSSDSDMSQYCIIESPPEEDSTPTRSTRDRINEEREDYENITSFYNIKVSPTRKARLRRHYTEQLDSLCRAPFDSYDQEEKIDYLLLKNYFEKALKQIELDEVRDEKLLTELPFTRAIIDVCEARQRVEPMSAQESARIVNNITQQIVKARDRLIMGMNSAKADGKPIDKTTAYRAAKMVEELRVHLVEWYGFYNNYDPMFTWWMAEPYAKLNLAMETYVAAVTKELLGIEPRDENVIFGDPIGRKGLLADLHAELIPYSPEEILKIGDIEYAWCEKEMKKASGELGYGDDWREALEYVKTLYVEPGQQTQLVKKLSQEATDYVTKRDLITVPSLAAETIVMNMMSPQRQLQNPFFLGGEEIIVSYPTSTMPHEAKMMSLRGNNVHFSRSTVFHELIPGHHLQLFMNARHRSYRQMFQTCFSIEGWAFYWEMILWDDEHFPKTPENRIGMLFWRMHRCCRIMFSINFHLGKMTPQECIDLLVNKGGHERATAEGEVRRSFAGDYPPLYQAGYMLGALQLYALRGELVNTGVMKEKTFHDRIMREGQMPIELLRALLKKEPLDRNYKASWRFYDGLGTDKAAADLSRQALRSY